MTGSVLALVEIAVQNGVIIDVKNKMGNRYQNTILILRALTEMKIEVERFCCIIVFSVMRNVNLTNADWSKLCTVHFCNK